MGGNLAYKRIDYGAAIGNRFVDRKVVQSRLDVGDSVQKLTGSYANLSLFHKQLIITKR